MTARRRRQRDQSSMSQLCFSIALALTKALQLYLLFEFFYNLQNQFFIAYKTLFHITRLLLWHEIESVGVGNPGLSYLFIVVICRSFQKAFGRNSCILFICLVYDNFLPNMIIQSFWYDTWTFPIAVYWKRLEKLVFFFLNGQ